MDVVSGVVSSVADTDGDMSISDNLREAGENKYPRAFHGSRSSRENKDCQIIFRRSCSAVKSVEEVADQLDIREWNCVP